MPLRPPQQVAKIYEARLQTAHAEIEALKKKIVELEEDIDFRKEADRAKLPCGHNARYGYTPDGGKTGFCTLCEAEELRRQLVQTQNHGHDLIQAVADEVKSVDTIRLIAARLSELREERPVPETSLGSLLRNAGEGELAEARQTIGDLRRTAESEERAHGQTIDERDQAEEAMGEAYALVTGKQAEWSNLFGYNEANREIEFTLKERAEQIEKLQATLVGVRADAAQPEFKPGQKVMVDNERYHGPGVVHDDTGIRRRKIGVTLGNGNTWWYEVETVKLIDASSPEGR